MNPAASLSTEVSTSKPPTSSCFRVFRHSLRRPLAFALALRSAWCYALGYRSHRYPAVRHRQSLRARLVGDFEVSTACRRTVPAPSLRAVCTAPTSS